MSEPKERLSISRYAKLREDRLYWNLDIARLYSKASYKRDDKGKKTEYQPTFLEFGGLGSAGSIILKKYSYPTMKYYIAVKELIIEWQDYQAEVSGYIHCQSCEDLVDQSHFLTHAMKSDAPKTSHTPYSEIHYANMQDSKQILRFVKSPGLKTTSIKIEKENLEFFPIDMHQCEIDTLKETLIDSRFIETRNEHILECQIRPLFDQNQILPIKYAHITVEIYIK